MSDDPLMIEPIMEYRRACNLAGLTLEQSDRLRPFFESLLARAEAAEAECARLRQALAAEAELTDMAHRECARLRQDAEGMAHETGDIRIVVDPTVPPDRAEFRDASGKVVGVIKGDGA